MDRCEDRVAIRMSPHPPLPPPPLLLLLQLALTSRRRQYAIGGVRVRLKVVIDWRRTTIRQDVCLAILPTGHSFLPSRTVSTAWLHCSDYDWKFRTSPLVLIHCASKNRISAKFSNNLKEYWPISMIFVQGIYKVSLMFTQCRFCEDVHLQDAPSCGQ